MDSEKEKGERMSADNQNPYRKALEEIAGKECSEWPHPWTCLKNGGLPELFLRNEWCPGCIAREALAAPVQESNVPAEALELLREAQPILRCVSWSWEKAVALEQRISAYLEEK